MFRDADNIAGQTIPSEKDGSYQRRRAARKGANRKDGFWKKQARTWHWVSGAICLTGMLFFSLTGITLNHAKRLTEELTIVERTVQLPPDMLETLTAEPVNGYTRQLRAPLRAWIEDAMAVSLAGRRVEWTEIDAYVLMERPGGEAWLSIDRETGEVVHELTTRGSVAFLNDLHRGSGTGPAWTWFIDLFAIASVVFCATGLWLLQVHASKRRSTWFVVGAGFLVPILLVLVSVH